MTIEELINTGEQFEIKTEPTRMQEGPLGYPMIVKGYKYLPQSDKFATWLQQCIRFISLNYPKDFSVEEFQKIEIENVTQGTIYKLIGILKALKDNPVICDEILGRSNFIATVAIRSSTPSGVIKQLTEQIKIDEEKQKLQQQIANLERQMNATKQPRRKRELYLEIQKLKGIL